MFFRTNLVYITPAPTTFREDGHRAERSHRCRLACKQSLDAQLFTPSLRKRGQTDRNARMNSVPVPQSSGANTEPKASPLDAAERIVVSCGWATPAQATRARALIPAGTNETGQVAKFLRVLQDQNIMT